MAQISGFGGQVDTLGFLGQNNKIDTFFLDSSYFPPKNGPAFENDAPGQSTEARATYDHKVTGGKAQPITGTSSTVEHFSCQRSLMKDTPTSIQRTLVLYQTTCYL